jgi:V/A-type H+-transporting ATPase subunit I
MALQDILRVIAALFHALNIAMGAFSPSIHALRLHYVEFFSKFYEAGGTPFQPFGSSSADHWETPRSEVKDQPATPPAGPASPASSSAGMVPS